MVVEELLGVVLSHKLALESSIVVKLQFQDLCNLYCHEYQFFILMVVVAINYVHEATEFE
jgi:hypothetical protein